MKSKPPMTPEAQERLRELYRKCSTGLLLLPENLISEGQLGLTSARATQSSPSSTALKPRYFDAWFYCPEPPNPLPAAFGVITPCNPFGHPLPDDQNASRLAQLAEHLAARKIGHFRADGGSQDGRHQEAGFGVIGLTLAELRELGVQFDQDAIFWIESDQVILVSCTAVGSAALGKWSERQTSWPNPFTPRPI